MSGGEAAQRGTTPDPRAAGLNSIEPRVRCFGSGAFDHGAIAPLGTATGVSAPATKAASALGYTALKP